MQKFSYHTHTTFSDGYNSAEDMIIQAKKLGWEEIGISDHLIIHKDAETHDEFEINRQGREKDRFFMLTSFAEAREVVLRHYDNLDTLSKKHNIKVLKGFEMDYFTYDGWEDELRDFKKQIKPDYLLNGNHSFFNEECTKLFSYFHLRQNKFISDQEIDEYSIRYYKTIEKAIKSGLFDIIAHIDCIRLDHKPRHLAEKAVVVRALAQTGVAAELSSRGLLYDNTPYPHPSLLADLVAAGVNIVISDDAHKVENLGYGFDKLEDVLATFNNVKRFRLK